MKLIVGLGNPGKEYENTRHNVGFMVIDNYLKNVKSNNFKTKFSGLYVDLIINGEKVIFLKPQKYMNLSGEVIREFIKFYKVNIEDLLIISDDIDMLCGKIRLRSKGSSGGHNGLKNIELETGTNEYKRLKIGVGNNKNVETKDYVLGKFDQQELQIINETIEKTEAIINDFLQKKFDELMSKYN
ncbi:MAG: aminoacyl-tRNA hydrolase [Firmicutes bacterium]|nr:aminoacyl-tRNA hydrolase [Bacillota bacterium]